MQASTLGPIFNTKLTFKVLAIFLFCVVSFCLYFNITTLFYFANFIFCSVMLFVICSAIIKSDVQRESWILIALAIIVFMTGDVIWYVYKFVLMRTYGECEFVHLMFLLPTCCIFGANFIFLMRCFDKNTTGDHLIVINDMISVLLMTAIFFVAVLDGADVSNVYTSATHFSGFLNTVFGFFVLFCVMSMIYSNQISKLNTSMFLFLVASAFFACVRIFYSYNVFSKIDYDNIFLVLLFDVVFLLFAFGAFEALEGKNRRIKSTSISVLIKYMWPVFLVPLVIKNEQNVGLLVIMMSVFVLYSILNYYTKNSDSMRRLEDDEKKSYQALEFELSRQTNELILTNLKLKETIDKDYLTGIGSRNFIMEKLAERCKFLRQGNSIVAYYINIRRFKNINTTYGQEIGDKILRIIGKRIASVSQKGDVVGRFSADEFIVIQNMMNPTFEACKEFASKLTTAIANEMTIGLHHFVLESVVGIDIAGVDKLKTQNPKDIIKNADKAMYFAKHSASTNIFIYDESMNEKRRYRAKLEILMHQAVLTRDFEVYYQPIFDLKSGKVIFAEALIRWNNKEFGFLEAAKFIDIVKSSEYVTKIYGFVLHQVARAIKELEKNGLRIGVSINITYRQTTSSEFINMARNIMQSYELDPKMLGFEFNESIWSNESSMLDEIFSGLKELGVGVCIDDFGIGQASLVYLKKYNIHAIKVAPSLTKNITNSKQDAQILSSVAAVGKSMKIKTVIKNVESDEMLLRAKELGCDEAQGYILSYAMNVDRLVKFVNEKGVILPFG